MCELVHTRKVHQNERRPDVLRDAPSPSVHGRARPAFPLRVVCHERRMLCGAQLYER